jgi:L-threonylcarbamoyladenylate synthase
LIVERLGDSEQDTEEVARNFYGALRNMDQRNVDVIFIEGVRESGSGIALMNRMKKAASTHQPQ